MKNTQPFQHVTEYVKAFETGSMEIAYMSRITAGKGRELAGWRLEKHSHPYLEFLYFIEGRAEVQYTDNRLQPGIFNLMVYPSGLVHQEYPDSEHSLEVVAVGVHVNNPVMLEVPFQLTDRTGEFLWLFEHLEQEWSGKQTGYERIIHVYLQAVMELMKRYFIGYGPNTNELMDYCIQYINKHYSENLTLETLSSLVHVSPSYLTRLFKRHTGMAPIHYLNGLRINIAKRLLYSTELPVARVADHIGFPDALYFSRLFRKLEGVPPREYRKNAEKNR